MTSRPQERGQRQVDQDLGADGCALAAAPQLPSPFRPHPGASRGVLPAFVKVDEVRIATAALLLEPSPPRQVTRQRQPDDKISR